MSALLEATDICHTYRSLSGEPINALDHIDLAVDRGDFLCIVGPSGCGKTSFLKILAGLIRPTCGEVHEAGEHVMGPAAQRGYVFQHPELYPWLTVMENAAFGLRMQGMSRLERRNRARKCLEMVKLWEFRNSYPYELSGGMQQRAAIARTLAVDPHILLMDEPFGALDALTREHMQEELLTIWRRTQKTVVLVTHNVDEAVYLATHLVVLSPRPGRIMARFEPQFSRASTNGSSRKIRSLPEFIDLRESILSFIW